jgi:hypothetical protein
MLNISSRTAWMRKRETHPFHTLNFFITARQLYLRLAEDLHVEAINTDDDTIQDTVSKVILKLKNKGFNIAESS